jgi:hypothetical protein
MNCNTARESIFDRPTAELEAHLAACSECAREFQSLKATMALLDEWKAPEGSPFFGARVRARAQEIREQQENGAFAWLRAPLMGLPAWRPALAAALAVVMAIGVSITYRGGENKRQNITIAREIKGTAVGDLLVLEKEQHIFTELELLDDLAADPAAEQDHI